MKKTLALSAVLILGVLGAACPDPPANNSNVKANTPANTVTTNTTNTTVTTTNTTNTTTTTNTNAKANDMKANTNAKDDKKP